MKSNKKESPKGKEQKRKKSGKGKERAKGAKEETKKHLPADLVPSPEEIDRIIKKGSSIKRDDFTKLQLLGRGDVGKVYLVRHNKTGKCYAMKVIPKEEMVRRNKVKRALTEREILTTANHPFIVTLFYSFMTNKNLYFITTYCAGGEFFRVLQRQPGGHLTEDQARFYAAEVLLALEYLHMMGFIYRDLKPENLLLHSSGHIVLTDFDLSKQAATPVAPKVIREMWTGNVSKVSTKPELTTNSFVGTEEYIAPEVIEGFGHTSAVDWWAFGILLFEMLFGKTPFRGKTRKDTFDHILRHSWKWPSTTVVSKEGKSIIKKLLEKNPKKRLGTTTGAADIKEHPFFKGKINWALIRNQKPPIIPKLKHPADTRYFYPLEEEEDADHEEEPITDDDVKKDKNWNQFTSHRKKDE